MGVYLRCGIGCAVALGSRHGSDRYAVGNLKGCVCVPLRYNKDKRKNLSDTLQIEESIYNRELHAALEDAFSVFTGREREVLALWYFFNINYSEQAVNKNVSRSYIALVAGEAFEKIRNSGQIMTRLAGFMPQYEYAPIRFTGYSSWQHSDFSVQDRYPMGQMDSQDEALNFLIRSPEGRPLWTIFLMLRW